MSESGKIKLIVVDDSITYRNMLHQVLSEDPDLEVVSQASNGKLAIPRIKHYKPDFVLLDQEMPEMTGIELLAYMKKEFPDVGVLMFSSKTVQGAKITMEALELGALDFVTKPEFSGHGDAKAYIREKVITRLKALHRSMHGDRKVLPGSVKSIPTAAEKKAAAYQICTIGISTGGPQALRELLPLISGNLNGAIVLTQHMPPIFTFQLAESLNQISALTVKEGENGETIQKGTVYIAPGGKHMIVAEASGQRIIKITDDPPELNCKPSVNILFRSVAEVYGTKSCAIIMTGMGSDGHEGMKKLVEKGAYCISQDPESCLIFGMPALPVKEGLVQEILNIKDIAKRIEFLIGTSG